MGARELIEELTKLVVEAEKAAEGAHDEAGPLRGEHTLEGKEVLAKAQAVEKAGKVAMSSCSRCADFLVGKRPIIDEASEIRNETTAALLAVQPRIQAATRQATEVLGVASSSKQKISAKMAAKKRADKNKATFAKYDKDGDGYLSKEEIIAYTKGEYDFALPEG